MRADPRFHDGSQTVRCSSSQTRLEAGEGCARLPVMPRRFLFVVLIGGLVGCHQGPEPHRGPPEPPEVVYGSVKERDRSGKAHGADFTAVVAAQNAFALRLLGALRDAAADRNVAVGGYSVNQVLGMLYAGARGATAEDLKRALGWDLPPERLHATMNALDLELLSRGDDVTLAVANRVWGQKGASLLPTFLDVLTRHYGAPLAVADFATAPEEARATINGWVHRATGNKIAELFPAGTIDTNTRLVLANAMYLDAPWKYKLDPAATRKAPFTRLDGSKVEVDMMHYDEFLPSVVTADWQVVELPYRGDELAMVVIVPTDLRAFEARPLPRSSPSSSAGSNTPASICRSPS